MLEFYYFQHKGAGFDADRINPHQAGRGGVVAHQEHMRAKSGAVEQKPRHAQQRQHPERLHRHAEIAFAQQGVQAGIHLGRQGHACAVHDHQFQPAKQERGANGDNK